MHIDKYMDVILNCRFCFMCRHISPVGNVLFTEADTPRVRAAALYGVSVGARRLGEGDFIEILYRHELSACCRHHCVNHFDENGLILAARADAVEAGLAPEAVRLLADTLASDGEWTIDGDGEVAYFEDAHSAESKVIPEAFAKIMASAGIGYRKISGGNIGKGLKTLGYIESARERAAKFAGFLKKNGVKTLVVSSPAAYDALVNDMPEYGVELGIDTSHSSSYIASLGLDFTPCGSVRFIESDFLRNYCGEYSGPRELLAALGAPVMPFGTNNEESYTCGEGAIFLPRLNEKLVARMAKYVAERAGGNNYGIVAVASPYTRICLAKYTKLNVLSLEELAARALPQQGE